MPENPKISLTDRLKETSNSLTSDLLNKRLESTNTYVGDIAPQYGKSQFDKEAPIPSVLGGNLDEFRGERQSRLDKLGNVVPRLLSKVGTEFAKTPGYLYALGEAGLTDKTLAESLDNAWLNTWDNMDQATKDKFPIYKPKSVVNGNLWDNLTSTSFWTDEGVDGVGFLLSMLTPGAALKATGIAGKLAKLPMLSELGQANIELGQATLLNTALESAAETKGVVDDLNNQFKVKIANGEFNPTTGQVWTEEEAKQAVGEAAVNTFQMNMGLLLVPNIIMNKNLLGRFGSSKSILNEFRDASGRLVTTNPLVKKSLVKEYAKGIGEAALSEGFLEEAGQTTIENYNKKVALGKTNAGILEGLANEYIETLGSTEGQKAILLGTVLGSLGGTYGKSKELKAEDRQRSVLGNLIKDNFEGFSTSMDSLLEKDEQGNTIIDEKTGKPKINIEQTANVITNLVKEQQSTNLQDLEALKGNKDMYDYIFNQQLARFALPYLNVEGGTEILDQHIDDLSKHIVGAKDDKLTDNQYRSEIKQQIKSLKSAYDSLNDSINEMPLEELSKDTNLVGQFSNKLLNTAYQETSKQLFLNNKIKDLNKDLLTLEVNASEIPQFTIEREKIINRLESLKTSLELSKNNYKSIFDPIQQKKAFAEFSNQVADSKETIAKEQATQEEEIKTATVNPTETNDLTSKINNANSKEDLDRIWDEHYDETNGEELSNLMGERMKTIDEQNSHLEAVDTVDKTVDSLNKQDHTVEINNFKTSLESIKGLSNYDNFSDELKNRLDSTLSKINNLLVDTDDNHDVVNDTSNDTTTVVTQNNDIQANTSLGLQNGIVNFKSFSSKVYNAVMMRLFESHYVPNRGFQFIKNNEGEAIRTSTLISMVVNDPSIVKSGDLLSFELITLPENQQQENLANINNSKKVINEDKSGDYTNEDKEFGKYYNETIGIRHKESNELIGFVGIPHAISISEVDDEKSIQAKQTARKALIEQRKTIIDLLDNNKTVETKIFEKGPGKLLLKSNKDGVPIMSTIISRDQDLIDGRDIFVIDKGYDENGNIEGFVIPNSDNFNKTKDKVKINEINNNLIGRTFSDKEGNNKGRIYKAVKNANDSWSLIPVYSTNIGLTKAQSLVNKLKKFITPVEGGYTVDLKTVYKELGKDIYITNTDKRGSLKIDKFTINGRPWGALLNSKPFEDYLTDHISKSKNNITTQLLNVDNAIKNILETNAYQEEGQYFVQPYIEFEGLYKFKVEQEQVVEESEIVNPITIEDKLDLNDDVDSIGTIIDDEVFSTRKDESPLQRDKISQYLRDKLPGLILADEKTVNDTKPFVKDAVGMFYKSTIYLFNGASNSTAYHEAFHGVFRNMLSVGDRVHILNEAKKQFPTPTQRQLDELSNTLTPETKAKLSKDKLNSVLEQLYYEEKLADAFAEYTNNLDSKSLLGRIKDFFKKIFKVFNLFKRYNEDQITTLFENINAGTFREISKQSLYNRSINSVLLQPAYKKPNNVPLSEFLNRSKSIEDVFYYRFNQQLELGLALDKIRVGDIFEQIKQDYKIKAIEFNKNKDLYRSAVAANVYNNWSNYLDQVKKNLEKRKIKIKDLTIKSTDLSIVPDETNNIKDLDILEVETGINKAYGQEMTAISGIRSAGDKLKLFLSALPIIENNKVKKDSYGFEQFYDYEKVYYQLEKALLNKQTYEEQYDEVEYLASYKPEMQSVKEALDRLKGEEGELIKKQFRTNFFKQQLRFKLVLFEKNRESGKYTYKLIDSNRKDIKRSIQEEWENNLIDPSRTKDNLVKSFNSEYVLDSKKVKSLQEEFNKSDFNKDYLFNTLYKLGIEFKKVDFDKVYNTNSRSIISNINSYLNFLEAKSLDVLNGEEAKTLYKRGREAFEWFVNQQTIFNENLYTESLNNVENSIVYSIQNTSFASRLTNKLTQGNTDNFIKDLKRDPIYKYLSILENPVITKTLQSYAIDGLKDGVGENEGKKYRSIHPNDFTVMAITAYINSSGNQSLQGISTAIYTPIVPSEKTQAFLNQGPKYSGFIISNDQLIETEDTQRFNKIFWLEADRIKQAIKDKELHDSETQLIKDGKLKVRTFNPNPNYHGKNFNGNAYSFNILNYSKSLQKGGELYTKIFSEFSNSNLNAQEFFSTSGKYKSEINNEVLTVLNNKYKEQLDSLIASGIIKQSSEGILSSNVIDLADFDTTISETDRLKNLVAGFSLNTSLFNIEYSLLMNGDPAYYKNSSDWGKRFYQSQAATSSYDSADFKDGKIQIMAFNDIEQSVNKESYNDILAMTKGLSDADITKSILDNDYNQSDSINVADAQFYVSPLLYEKLERSQGKITKEKTKALEIANGSTQGINSKDYHQQIGIMKTFTFGVEWNDRLARYEPKQIKCAVLPLTESLVVNNPLLKKALDKMLSNPDGPQAMALKSTFKALQPSYQDINDIDNFDMNKVVDLEVENMGLQVDNPNHGLDSENSSTRQLKMLFYGMLDNDTEYGGIKGSDIKNELQQLESKNNLDALNNLVDLFVNKDERLLKMINEAITKRNATSIIEKVFDIDPLTGDFRFPLDTIPTRQTIELLSSIFTNNVVLQEFKGGSMVQATSLGFQFKSQFKNLEEQQGLVNNTKELKDVQTSLQWIRKQDNTTIDYIEVALPYYYSDFLDNNGQFKKDIPEGLLRIIGYRIPTEGAHSMLPLKVVKFLPKEYGNVILLPYEITKQMGADFDFDKIYFLSRDYYNKGQELKPYKYDVTEAGLDTRYEQYINSVLNTNKEALQLKKEARVDAKEANKIAKEAGEEIYKYTFQDDINLLIEEGYIVSKEDFADKPVEDQLTKEARNNRILDLYTSVLRDVNTLNSLIAPSGPGSISDVYNQVAQYKEAEVGDYFSFIGQLKIKKLFDDIIGLKGQSALKVTGHAFVSLGNLEAINNPFRYKENNNINTVTNLSKIKSNVGGKIVEELSSMMAAILDAVKTPTMLPYLNISSKTINVWSTIVRFGMGTKVASEFTSQEAVGLVSERLMDNDKQIKDGSQFNNRVVEETFNNYKAKFLNLYNNFEVETISPQFFGKIIDNDKELNNKLNENIVDLNQLSKFAGKSEQVIKDLIKKDNSLTRENKIKELMSFYLTQMNTLKSFENLEDLSKKLQQVDSIFGLNKQVGPTFETVNGKQEVINEVYNYEYDEEAGMGVFNGIQDLLNKPIINSYININKNFMSLLNQKFGFANDYYNSIKNIIGSGLNVKNNRGLLGIKPEDRDKINSFIFSYLDAYSTMEKEYSQSPEQSGFTDKEFIDEITKLKSEKFDENYQWKIFGNRRMKPETKTAISNSTLIQHLQARFIKNSDIKAISLKGNKLELAQKEKIIDDLNKFYKSEATKPMVEILVKHSFKYSGFYTGLSSYHTLIDPSILQDMGFITNRGIIKEIINSDISNPIKSTIFIERMVDQFIRNNSKLTKTFDLKEDIGSKLFTESIINNQKIFIINDESKHSRASELFKKSKEGEINALSYIRIYLSDKTTEFKGAKLFKLIELEDGNKGYIEVSKLGVPKNLVEVNPYFDLEKSVYQPNNYVKFTKPNDITENTLKTNIENYINSLIPNYINNKTRLSLVTEFKALQLLSFEENTKKELIDGKENALRALDEYKKGNKKLELYLDNILANIVIGKLAEEGVSESDIWLNLFNITKNNNEELTAEEEQVVGGDTNEEPINNIDQLLEEELDNSYNKQKDTTTEINEKPNPKEYINYSIVLRINDLINQIEQDFKDNLISLQRKEEVINIIQSSNINNEEELGDLINKLCL